MRELIEAAWKRRSALHELDAYRVFHGWSEGVPGLEIDRYADAAVVSYKARVELDIDAVAAALIAVHPFDLIVAKPRDARPVAVIGSLPDGPHLVRELGMTFALELEQPRNPGLYLDARPARAWIHANSSERRVLNLFAFTGSLGVSAAVGGARSVTHVDSQRGALRRCKHNHELNGVAIDDRDLMRVNIYQHLRRASAKRRRFDAIILDAPPYSEASARSDRTPGARGLPALAALTAPLLNPGGWLLCFFHHSPLSHAEHEAAFVADAGMELDIAWRGTSGDDFPESDERNKLRLTAFTKPA